MIYIGIDPGKDGAMAMLFDGSCEADIWTFSPESYKMVCERYGRYPAKCCLERVGPIRGNGVTSMFNFGQNFGFIQGLLTAHSIPYELVTPQKWKKEFQVTGDKNSSIAVCKRLFPGVSLRRTERCTKDHDGMAEALLMAEYARRHL